MILLSYYNSYYYPFNYIPFFFTYFIVSTPLNLDIRKWGVLLSLHLVLFLLFLFVCIVELYMFFFCVKECGIHKKNSISYSNNYKQTSPNEQSNINNWSFTFRDSDSNWVLFECVMIWILSLILIYLVMHVCEPELY